MRIMISGGGTGGHIYPMLAVVNELTRQEVSRSDIIWLGCGEGLEESVVSRSGFSFRRVSSGALREFGPWRALGSLCRLGIGMVQVWRIMREFKPDVICVSGGYTCAPVALAAWLRRLPILVYLPDMEPGLAVRLASKLATRVAVSFEESEKHLPSAKVVVTGYPVRAEMLTADKLASKEKLGLEAGLKTLLVFGGSQGAHSINLAVSQMAAGLIRKCQILHITGARDEGWVKAKREEIDERLRSRYHVYSYLHEEMAAALAAADLAISRAGAAVLGEFPCLGLPSILIPYPYAGRHQARNADFMVEKGAAITIEDEDLPKGALTEVVTALLNNDEALQRLGQGASLLAQPEAARRIADNILDLGQKGGRICAA